MTTDTSETHAAFMQVALGQARLALEAGNMPVGAAIVHAGKVLAVGLNAIDHPPNDTHHAEMTAILSVTSFLAAHKREGTLYTTLGPCMMNRPGFPRHS